MTRVILIRHGQTEWNRIERFRGRAGLDLNENGMKQAEAVARMLSGWQVSAIYSSPLKRAMTTAQIIGGHLDLPVHPLEGLLDIDYGAWQGLSPEEAAERDARLYSEWLKSPHLVCFPQGEALENVRKRAMAALEAVLGKHGEETVALVSHKVVCKVMVCAALGLDNSHFWHVEQDVAAINIFVSKGGLLAVTLVNDTCHLRILEY